MLFGVLLSISACATKVPLTYNKQDSKALNIAKAANIEYGLKDAEVPEDTLSDFRQTKVFGMAYGLVGYNSPMYGLPSSGSAGMNILAWALMPKSPSARNSIIAWMPESIGAQTEDGAINKMADLIISATEMAAKDLKFLTKAYIAKNGMDKRGFAISLTNDKSEHCKVPEKENSTVSECVISYKVRRPHKISNTPDYIGGGKTWFFDPVERMYTAMIFKKIKYFQYNQLELLVAVSKYLPVWVYIYLAPGEVRVTEKDHLKVPLILNRGQLHYFIKAKSS